VSEQDLGDWTAVGEALVARRKAQKMTQDELHDAADVSIFVISEIEKAEKIRNRAPGTLERLSRALDWPANHLDNILNRHLTPGPVTPEQPVGDLTPAEEAFRRSIEEKLDNLNGKLDALLKHHDIMWQPGQSSGTSVEPPGYDHGHEPPKPKDGGPAPKADE
jgi:transcriptional regulator with XRE-family HTH domain